MEHTWAPLERLKQLNATLAQKGTRCLSSSKEELTKTMGLNLLLSSSMVEGTMVPAMKAMIEMHSDVASSWIDALSGRKELSAHLMELNRRVLSGLKYGWLITHLGRELFGSATFEGERLLADNELMRLSYLPPSPDAPAQPTALFHVGGFLPFSDRIFRFLPEANLYSHFLRRGIGVYAMELKRDLSMAAVGGCTLARLIDMIDELSDIAFDHGGRRRMLIEGYCGLAIQVLAYLAARPREAGAKFDVAFTMVGPVDGRACTMLHESVATTPRHVWWANGIMSEMLGGYVPGTSLQTGMDIPLRSLFYKSVLGRFAMGWKQHLYSSINSVDQLNAAQRKELAGAYWISPEHARLAPMPADLTRFTTELWLGGIDDDLELPYDYQGRRLTLRTILDQTEIRLAGFYGGKDRVVPDSTAQILQRTMGSRYTHIVHPKAGHISYVMSPEIWDLAHPRALDPNPIDVVLGLAPGERG